MKRIKIEPGTTRPKDYYFLDKPILIKDKPMNLKPCYKCGKEPKNLILERVGSYIKGTCDQCKSHSAVIPGHYNYEKAYDRLVNQWNQG